LGAAVNWAVSSLAYEPRHFSPWSRKHPRDERSAWIDRLPIVGWLRLRRKSARLGDGFWVRPLVVELCLAAALAGLYAWEVLLGKLLPIDVPPQGLIDPLIAYPLHMAFLGHALLATFMAAASLIDVDEKFIPDWITVTGALVGLNLVTALPWALLPIDANPQQGLDFLRATFGLPRHQGTVLNTNFPNVASLVIVSFCYLLWCGGLLYRPWKTSRGYGVAVRLLWTRLRQEQNTKWVVLLACVGLGLIAAVWRYEPILWIGLATSAVGLAVGGGIVWIVRVVGGWAMRRQAMGFGDVTLMAMIGAYVGWQAAVLIFFAAPIAALALHGSRWLYHKLLKREAADDLPYGPYLCLSTAAIIVAWRPVWEFAEPRFGIPWLIPQVLVVGFVLLGAILALLQWLKSRGA
jgi:prepilin signal peptidase PulO-like enzyme (type II secretory pathway)